MSETLREDGTERDAGLTALYRAAAREEPPPALDEAVRAAARRVVSSRPRRVSAPFIRSWRLPLALAAVVLMSVTLVTVMREEAPEVMLPPSVESTPAEAQHMRSGPAVDARERAAAVPKALAPDVPRSERVGPKPPQRSPAAGVGLDGSSGSPDSALRSRQDTIAGSRMESDVPAAPALARRATREALPGDPGMRDKKLATPAAPPSMPLPAPQVAGAVLPDAELPPDKWVERIVALRAQGKLEEAKSSLAEFRKRYPEYALPASLKDWGRP